ncbi:peroxisomal sarcosine oxidase [Plakobranchus ocellatus]|uniref:Peroxisomal sarcosine oxidase n=1 Tax=Plakobranchus ocellatus TaxID=259542 RepID=A0AAV3ZBJ3_9GAST|nr:peroxisomal sarcosine oxidase [Plakobranchus ocellatus]
MYWRIKPGQEEAHQPDKFPCFIDARREKKGIFDVYGLPCEEYPGLVKVACHGGTPCNPNHRDLLDEDDSWVIDQVKQNVVDTFPGLEPEPAIIESCIYTMTPDDNPYIDRHPKYNNIIFAAGFSGHGFKLAPAVGKAITELVTGREPTYNMKPFKIGRFDTLAKL